MFYLSQTYQYLALLFQLVENVFPILHKWEDVSSLIDPFLWLWLHHRTKLGKNLQTAYFSPPPVGLVPFFLLSMLLHRKQSHEPWIYSLDSAVCILRWPFWTMLPPTGRSHYPRISCEQNEERPFLQAARIFARIPYMNS